MISRVKPHKWLARSVQGRRSFSFALLCCVHQRVGASFVKKRGGEKPPGMGRRAANPPQKHAFARRAFVFGGGLRRNANVRRRVFAPGLAGALRKVKKAAAVGAAFHSMDSRPLNMDRHCTDLDPAICGGGRRPRPTADDGRRPQPAKGHDRRRPKAGVGACRASRARTRAEEAPIRVRKGPFDPPLRVSPLVSCMPQRRHVASQQRHTPFHGAVATRLSTLPP